RAGLVSRNAHAPTGPLRTQLWKAPKAASGSTNAKRACETIHTPVEAERSARPVNRGERREESKTVVHRPLAPLRRHPDNILRRILDIARLAMHTVLRIDLQAIPAVIVL